MSYRGVFPQPVKPSLSLLKQWSVRSTEARFRVRRWRSGSRNLKRGGWHTILLLPLAALAIWGLFANAQSEASEPTPRQEWTAEWISHPTAPLREPAVFHFKKILRLDTKPAHFNVLVSADNRFILFVNGIRIGRGPAKGDLAHWRYETFDLAPSLHPGKNVLTAIVWNFGIYTPLAQFTDRTAFLMQGESSAEAAVNTGPAWQVEQEPGFSFLPRLPNGFFFYWAADPGEKLDARLYDWNWQRLGNSSRSHWVAAATAVRESIYSNAARPSSRGDQGFTRWAMVPDTLPQMEFQPVSAGRVVRTNLARGAVFPGNPVTIPPHHKVEILLDRQTMITGYPALAVSGGRGARIRIGYTEALYDAHLKRGNRNLVGNRRVLGLFDEFMPDGGNNRVFQPLWFRTWRYLELKVETGAAPLELRSLKANFSAFPFIERAQFSSSDPELEKIWNICWRGARLGAHETYMDTPFWEQLQYIDDTRIQTLISYTVAGDTRLARQALRAFDSSRIPDGITQSRYPSLLPQFIPNFSLSYINMLHDYWMYQPDDAILRELLPGTRSILEWFYERQLSDGFLKKLPYWVAIDSPLGVKDFPRLDRDGRSALVTLLFVDALKDAAEMEDAFGEKDIAAKEREAADEASEAVYKSCWNARLGLLADTPDQNSYSEHTNIFAVLTDTIPAHDQAGVIRKLIASHFGEGATVTPPMAEVSYHYQFYLSRAIDKAGLGEQYLSTLVPWHTMLALGLTTTPEYADPTRSDTHAWSAHPIYDLLTIVAGIHPSAPGFARVRIAPCPGNLKSFDVSMPHQNGAIRVRYTRQVKTADFVFTLPENLSGDLVWNGLHYPLEAGTKELQLPAASPDVPGAENAPTNLHF